MDCHNARDASFPVCMINCGTKNTKLPPCSPGGHSSRRHKGPAGLTAHVGNGSCLPIRHQSFDSRRDTPRRSYLNSAFLGVVGQNIGYKDLRWFSRTAFSDSCVNELGECDFSLFAVWSASAALPAAA